MSDDKKPEVTEEQKTWALKGFYMAALAASAATQGVDSIEGFNKRLAEYLKTALNAITGKANLPRTKRPDCHNCVHSGQGMSGGHHRNCSEAGALVDLNPHGVKHGWATWPIDFDPVWVESCDEFMARKTGEENEH